MFNNHNLPKSLVNEAANVLGDTNADFDLPQELADALAEAVADYRMCSTFEDRRAIVEWHAEQAIDKDDLDAKDLVNFARAVEYAAVNEGILRKAAEKIKDAVVDIKKTLTRPSKGSTKRQRQAGAGQRSIERKGLRSESTDYSQLADALVNMNEQQLANYLNSLTESEFKALQQIDEIAPLIAAGGMALRGLATAGGAALRAGAGLARGIGQGLARAGGAVASAAKPAVQAAGSAINRGAQAGLEAASGSIAQQLAQSAAERLKKQQQQPQMQMSSFDYSELIDTLNSLNESELNDYLNSLSIQEAKSLIGKLGGAAIGTVTGGLTGAAPHVVKAFKHLVFGTAHGVAGAGKGVVGAVKGGMRGFKDNEKENKKEKINSDYDYDQLLDVLGSLNESEFDAYLDLLSESELMALEQIIEQYEQE